MTNHVKTAALVAALLSGNTVSCLAAEPAPMAVEIESPLASPHPLQGYLRQASGAGPSPAVVLLHSCSGNWRGLDERWGKRIASWGYATLTVDSFGPRGIKSNCLDSATGDFASDAYRALNFLSLQPSVDPARVAAIGFSRGGLSVLSSVERGILEQGSSNKFRAAVAFYPPCAGIKGDVTVPTLILIGERDDLNLADDCRNMAAGRDGLGVSRQQDQGIPIKLVVLPGAYHAFDAPVKNPSELSGHHFEFNQSATDQSADALRQFLDATIGKRE